MTEQRRYVLGAEIRAEKSGDQMKICARAVKYGALSKRGVPAADAYERVAPGAFRDSLDGDEDVKCLLNHDPNFVLGRRANASLRLTDSPDALRFEVRLNPHVQFHRDVYNLVKDGTLDECSFAFAVDGHDGQSWDGNKDENGTPCVIRTVRKAKLYDVSIVASPAYGNRATSAEARSIAYEFKSEANEDVELAQRVARLGELVRADREAMLADAGNILTAHHLDNEIRRDEKRSEFEELRKELGL